jgi:glycosyltransferase involved in cell wall biosynthesis
MKETLDLTIILPIKSSLPRDFEEYFGKAISSIQNQKVNVTELLIVATVEEQLNSYLDSYDFGELKMRKVIWDKEPNYGNQVNFGIENSNTKWVSLFEFDDEYANIWFDNVNKYINHYPEIQAFLPVVVGVCSEFLTRNGIPHK